MLGRLAGAHLPAYDDRGSSVKAGDGVDLDERNACDLSMRITYTWFCAYEDGWQGGWVAGRVG